MSTLISSAVGGGKKAAPKAVGRRRGQAASSQAPAQIPAAAPVPALAPAPASHPSPLVEQTEDTGAIVSVTPSQDAPSVNSLVPIEAVPTRSPSPSEPRTVSSDSRAVFRVDDQLDDRDDLEISGADDVYPEQVNEVGNGALSVPRGQSTDESDGDRMLSTAQSREARKRGLDPDEESTTVSAAKRTRRTGRNLKGVATREAQPEQPGHEREQSSLEPAHAPPRVQSTSTLLETQPPYDRATSVPPSGRPETTKRKPPQRQAKATAKSRAKPRETPLDAYQQDEGNNGETELRRRSTRTRRRPSQHSADVAPVQQVEVATEASTPGASTAHTTRRIPQPSEASVAPVSNGHTDEEAEAPQSRQDEPQQVSSSLSPPRGGRSNQTTTVNSAQDEVAAESQTQPALTAGRRHKRRRGAAGDSMASDEIPNGAQRQPAHQPRKRAKKPGPVSADAESTPDRTDDSQTRNEDEEEPGEDDRNGAEHHEIDPSSLTMYELSRDSKHGKTSEREKKIASADSNEEAQKQPDPATEAEASLPPAIERTEHATEPNDPPSRTAAAAAASGPRFRIVDGQIVEDESTLTIDRQAQAEAEAGQSGSPVEESSELTRRVNRTTWLNDRRRDPADRVPMHRAKSEPWSEAETDRLFAALSMFGTDYFTISKMFPPKTRRQIKLKVQREEKIDAARVNAALLGRVVGGGDGVRVGGNGDRITPMSLELYARQTGRRLSDFTKYGDVEEAQRAIEESLKEKEEAMHRAIAEQEEVDRQRENFDMQQQQQQRGKGKKTDRPDAVQQQQQKKKTKAARKQQPVVPTLGGVPPGAGEEAQGAAVVDD